MENLDKINNVFNEISLLNSWEVFLIGKALENSAKTDEHELKKLAESNNIDSKHINAINFSKVVKTFNDLAAMDPAQFLSLADVIEKALNITETIGAAGKGDDSETEKKVDAKVNIIGKGFSREKTTAIKAIKDALAIGLADAKKMVDLMEQEGKCLIKENLSKEEAEKIKTPLAAAGINIEIS